MAKERIGAINKELYDKAKTYSLLANVPIVTLVEELLAEFFKDSLLTNSFIELEDPFYFIGYPLFYEDEIIVATSENPSGTVIEGTKIEPEEVYLVNKVPNNLDSFNKDFKKFCYGNNPNLHKGIYINHVYEAISDNPEESLVSHMVYLFEYNEEDSSLKIEDITFTDNLAYIINLATHKEVYDSITNEVENYNSWIFEEAEGRTYLSYEAFLDSFEVVEPFTVKTAFKNYLVEIGSSNPEEELVEIRRLISENVNSINPTDLFKKLLKL